MSDMIRVALIGKTGVGKSALGNTLLGAEIFETSIGGESETTICCAAIGVLESGLKIKVVDTPGVMDTKGRDVKDEVTKAIAYLSPGPHAFIIVMRPDRATLEERQVIQELRELFGDETFLKYSLIVMNRKADLKRKGVPIEIHDYIENYSSDEVKEIYRLCGKRIVAVENTDTDTSQYVEQIVKMIDTTQYFSHDYFQLMQKLKIQEKEIQFKENVMKLMVVKLLIDMNLKKLTELLEETAEKNDDEFCPIQ